MNLKTEPKCVQTPEIWSLSGLHWPKFCMVIEEIYICSTYMIIEAIWPSVLEKWAKMCPKTHILTFKWTIGRFVEGQGYKRTGLKSSPLSTHTKFNNWGYRGSKKSLILSIKDFIRGYHNLRIVTQRCDTTTAHGGMVKLHQELTS